MKKLFLLLMLPLVAFGVSGCTEKEPEVKNIIFMIGDGMGLAQASLTQIENKYAPTAFDRAQNVALQKTYSANNRVTDSAASGTALATGYKTNNSTLGQTPDGTPVESIIAKAEKVGYASGVVVTCYVNHATPAAFYAHRESRNDNEGIITDFMASDLDVVFGGGTRFFNEHFTKQNKNYVDELKAKGYNVLSEQSEMASVSEGNVVGLFAETNIPLMRNGRGDYLPKATAKALEILTNNVEKQGKEGFVLMVEGSQIDGEGHGNNIEGVLAETRDFAAAMNVAMDYADAHPGTLVVVTGDHETGGLSIPSNKTDFTLPESGISYGFSTTGHTGIMLPVYLYGTGADRINGIMENTELSQALQRMIGVWEEAPAK
ncbi:MAG: alkaline phosphatase [Alistipes sp.]|nr:alkaline phosphatase [Alistipes sp.]MBR7115662.1 alkaline phosphatase [Alistipes sp.]